MILQLSGHVWVIAYFGDFLLGKPVIGLFRLG